MFDNVSINWQLLLHTRRQRTLAVVLLVLALGLLGLVMYPQVSRALEARGQAQEEQATLDKLAAKLDSLNKANTEENLQDIDLVTRALPSKKPLVELLTSVTGAAESSGVVVREFSLSPGLLATESASLKANQAKTATDSLEVDLTVEGTFAQVQEFMRVMEAIAPFTTVSEVTIETPEASTADAAESTELITAELVTDTYFYTQPVKVSLETPLPTITSAQKSILQQLADLVSANVPDQQQIQGGGLEDLFGVPGYFGETNLEELETLIEQSTQPTAPAQDEPPLPEETPPVDG